MPGFCLIAKKLVVQLVFSFVLVIPHSRLRLRGILPFSTLDLGEVLMQVQHGDVYAAQPQGVDTRLVLDLYIFGAPGSTGKGLKLQITSYNCIHLWTPIRTCLAIWDHVRVLVSYDAVDTHFSFVFSDAPGAGTGSRIAYSVSS